MNASSRPDYATVFLGTISAYGCVIRRIGNLVTVRFGERPGDEFTGRTVPETA